MTAPAPRFGANANIYRDTASNWASPTWVAVNNVNDSLNAPHSFEETDTTIRGVGGVAMAEPTLFKPEISFKMLEDVADAQFLALRTAYFTKAILHVLICSGLVTVSGETFMQADMKIFEFKKSEPLNGINTYEITMKQCYSSNLCNTGLTPIGGASSGLG